MSRFSEWNGDEDDGFNGNSGYMWMKRAELALQGRRGRRALAQIREALMALPEHRLVESVMCRPRLAGDAADDAEIVGYEVCIIGAHVWYEKVKAGMDPTAAFQAVPRLEVGDDGDDYPGQAGAETARIGEEHGLTYTLAWELANMNDEAYGHLSPEERWTWFVAYIDSILALPPLKAAPRRVKRVRQPRGVAAREAKRGVESIPMGLVP